MPRPHEGPPRPGYGPADEALPDRALIPPAARPAGANWAGNHTYRARTLHRPTRLEELQEIVARASNLRVLGSRHSFSAIADADELISLEALASPVDRRPCRRDRVAGWRDDLWRARRAFGRRGPGAAQPRFAAAHLGRRRGGDGHARVRRPEREPGHRGQVPGARDLQRRGADDVERRPRLRRRGGRPRRAGRGHPDHPRRAAGLRGPPTGVRGPELGRPGRALRRDRGRRVQRQRLHPLAGDGRPGLDQVPDRRARAERAVRRATGHGRPAPDPRTRCRRLHAPARPARPVVGPPAALPHRLHAQRGGGAPVGVPDAAPARRSGHRRGPRPRRPDPAAAAWSARSAPWRPTSCG